MIDEEMLKPDVNPGADSDAVSSWGTGTTTALAAMAKPEDGLWDAINDRIKSP